MGKVIDINVERWSTRSIYESTNESNNAVLRFYVSTHKRLKIVYSTIDTHEVIKDQIVFDFIDAVELSTVLTKYLSEPRSED